MGGSAGCLGVVQGGVWISVEGMRLRLEIGGMRGWSWRVGERGGGERGRDSKREWSWKDGEGEGDREVKMESLFK